MSISGHLTTENYLYLIGEIHRNSGIVLDESKLYLVESRLAPICEHLRISSLNELCGRLRGPEGPALRTDIVEAMTTNETLFFRDPAAFEALRCAIVPELIEKRRAARRIDFWCAACSTGQEPYSLAILLLEMGLVGWDIRILATDLNRKVLERARHGTFMQIEVSRGLSQDYLHKYFHHSGSGWRVSERIRKMVSFEQFDLRESPSRLGLFDAILCRNVLIYLDVATKKRIVASMKRVLRDDGFLMLGCAENLLNVSDDFSKRVFNMALFYQSTPAGALAGPVAE